MPIAPLKSILKERKIDIIPIIPTEKIDTKDSYTQNRFINQSLNMTVSQQVFIPQQSIIQQPQAINMTT